MRYRVSQQSEEGYKSISDVLEIASEGDTIIVSPGIYREKIIISKAGISIIGEDEKSCIITYDDYANSVHDDGRLLGTFRSYSVLVEADHVRLRNLTIRNDSLASDISGQAIALYIDGDHTEVIHCNLESHQDTLFLAPLPPKPRIPDSFRGPSEEKGYRPLYSFFDHCSISGDIDFIFGSGMGVFSHCKLISKSRAGSLYGYVCAPSTYPHESYGFVFIDCSFEYKKGVKTGTVYLARPWRPFGQVYLYRCQLEKHIHPQLMAHWDGDMEENVGFSLEYCYFKGFNPNPDPVYVTCQNNVFDDHHVEVTYLGPLLVLSPWHISCLTR